MIGLTCMLALVFAFVLALLWPNAMRAVIASVVATASKLIASATRVLAGHRLAVIAMVRALTRTAAAAPLDPAVKGAIGPEGAKPMTPDETVHLVENVIGAVVFSAMAVVGAGAEVALLLLTVAAMFNQQLPSFPPVYQVGTLVVSGVVDVLFWGCVLVDQLGWTHLADWQLAGSKWKSGVLRGVAATMVLVLFAMFITAAVYRDQLLAMMGLGAGDSANAAALARIANLRLATLVMLAIATFITVLVAGTFPVRLARFIVALCLAVWAALIGVVTAILSGIGVAADGAKEASDIWFDTLRQEREARRQDREARKREHDAYWQAPRHGAGAHEDLGQMRKTS